MTTDMFDLSWPIAKGSIGMTLTIFETLRLLFCESSAVAFRIVFSLFIFKIHKRSFSIQMRTLILFADLSIEILLSNQTPVAVSLEVRTIIPLSPYWLTPEVSVNPW